MPILAVGGIDEDGHWEVLAFSVGERENQAALEDVLENLSGRGVEKVDLWITDGNKAMLNAVGSSSPAPNGSTASSTKWIMCWVTYLNNSKTRYDQSSRQSFIRPVEKRPTKSW